MSVECLRSFTYGFVLALSVGSLGVASRDAMAQSEPLQERLLAEPAEDLAADARELGDAREGALLFHSPGLGCAKCHVNEEGHARLGPDLRRWEREVDDVHLVTSVLNPSAAIEPPYRTLQLLTSDGRSVAGMPIEQNDTSITLVTGMGPEDKVVVPRDEIELEKRAEVSMMPQGQVNALRRRQQFLDLVAYLMAIRDGGPEVAAQLKPSAEAIAAQIPPYERELDHRGIIAEWNEESLERGEEIYHSLCVNCHGTIDRPGSLPTSLRFADGKFKYGSDPYSIYQTLTHGNGLMMPQPWMVPQQKYDVIHYLREHFLRPHNPSQLTEVTDTYLASLPAGDMRGPEPREIKPWVTMDYGPTLTTTIEFENRQNIAQKAIAIRLDEGPGGITRGDAWMAFEHDTLRMAAAWTGDFVDYNGIQFNERHGVHLKATGEIVAKVPTGPGWANPETGSFEDHQRVVGRDDRRYGPLPESWGKYLGQYRYEDQVILHYRVGRTEILERPTLIEAASSPIFARSFQIDSRPTDLEMVVTTFDQPATLSQSGEAAVVRTDEGVFTAIAIGMAGSADFRLDGQRLVLKLRAGEQSLTGSLVFRNDLIDANEMRRVTRRLARKGTALGELINGGPPQYATPIEVPAEPWFESEAWAVDELVRPVTNPWSARTRITGLDFYPDGDVMAVCTWDGDVWRVEGLSSIGTPDATLRWHRIATGMFQPLGILVEKDRLMVTCRDQLVALHDLNGDGEIDHYRCFNSDHQVTEHFHEFAMGLQRDHAGNYYYAKSARHALKAVVPHHGTLLRVSPDGANTEILATGFRAANGVCLNEDGTFIVTDQEGHWNPKNRINWVKPGGFYGNMFGYHDVTDSSNEAMDQPLCWITNEFDRSPAELLWVESDRWDQLSGSLLNLSYGYGRIYVVPYEQVTLADGETQMQGGMCALPIPDLPTGMIRGRFSPADGQLYVGGLFSWAGSRQEQEGGLFRIRHKGNRVDLPVGLHAAQGQLEIEMSDPLDESRIDQLRRYEVRTWDLRRTKNYGSPHLNEQELEVVSATLSEDGRRLRLEIPGLQPTWGMEVVCRLPRPDGEDVRRVIHNTIHRLPAPETP